MDAEIRKGSPVPPVTAIVVPVGEGTHGYSCKIENGFLYIPYNISIERLYGNPKVVVMIRDRFDAMKDYEE